MAMATRYIIYVHIVCMHTFAEFSNSNWNANKMLLSLRRFGSGIFPVTWIMVLLNISPFFGSSKHWRDYYFGVLWKISQIDNFHITRYISMESHVFAKKKNIRISIFPLLLSFYLFYWNNDEVFFLLTLHAYFHIALT